jgi:hypothetical protein
MKLNLILLLSLILLFVACSDEEIAIPQYYAGDQEFGWATGTRSGKEWEASGYWQYHQNDSTLIGISFETYNEFGDRRESYSLNEIPVKPGTYTIKGSYLDVGDGFVGGTYSRLAADGDAVIGLLEVNNDKNGFVTVTEFNTDTKIVKGTFEVYFTNENNINPVEIKDGKFELQLYE